MSDEELLKQAEGLFTTDKDDIDAEIVNNLHLASIAASLLVIARNSQKPEKRTLRISNAKAQAILDVAEGIKLNNPH